MLRTWAGGHNFRSTLGTDYIDTITSVEIFITPVP